MRFICLSLILACSVFVNAQELNTFSNGEVADADKINENFQLLSDDVEDLLSWQEQQLGKAFSPDDRALIQFHAVDVDCDEDPGALDDAMQFDFIEFDRLRLNIRGKCISGSNILSGGLSYRHIWLAGEGSYDTECSNSTTLQLADGVSGGFLQVGTAAGSLWLSCLTFDAPNGTYVFSYGHGYVRFENGVRTKGAAQQLKVILRENSTFRTFKTNRIDELEVRNNSLAYFQTPRASVDIGNLILRGGSMFTCRFCTDGSIESAQLRHGSKMTFMSTPSGASIQIDSLDAAQRSEVNIEKYTPNAEIDISISQQTLIEDSVIFESVSYR